MKLLHTSDLHLGKIICGKKFHEEFGKFLQWLLNTIIEQQVECLLIAGDIFDTTTPSNTTQNLYYSFLHGVSNTACRHVVIIGGNHDSPSLLDAPKRLLKQLNVSVVGSFTGEIEDEVIVLADANDHVEAIVLAVPFLRDRDVRKAEPGESIDAKTYNLIHGIHTHYEKVIACACELAKDIDHSPPLIAMGHLFAAGGKTLDKNEVRDLYVGSLAKIDASVFSERLKYVALGHLHSSQAINGCDHIRYSGSPLRLNFSDNTVKKSVTLIEIGETTNISLLPVPDFLPLQTISGSREKICNQIRSLVTAKGKAFIEIHYTGTGKTQLQQDLEVTTKGSAVEILRFISPNNQTGIPASDEETVMLNQLSEVEVFRKCLENSNVTEGERAELEHSFLEIIALLHEDDES